VIVAGHAYAGAVVGTAGDERVKALVYVAALAPDEGEAVAEVFYQEESHPKGPKLAPDGDGFIWMPDEGFTDAFAQNATPSSLLYAARCSGPFRSGAFRSRLPRPPGRPRPPDTCLRKKTA
jgi:hypothetical protein